jgi:hypothetical protein
MFNPTSVQHQRGFVIEQFDGVAQQTEGQQIQMVGLFKAISREIYNGQFEHPFEELTASFFREDQIIYLVKHNGEYVGFFIRRHCGMEQYRVINSRIAGVVPKYQKCGLYALIRELDFRIEWAQEPDRPRVLFYRTRNPILWFEMAKQCSRFGIDLASGRRDEELVELGAALARALYPEYEYHRDTMTSFRAYPKHVFYKDLPHHRDPALDRLFYSLPAMANSVDSPCFIGLLIPPKDREAGPG